MKSGSEMGCETLWALHQDAENSISREYKRGWCCWEGHPFSPATHPLVSWSRRQTAYSTIRVIFCNGPGCGHLDCYG